MKTKMYRTRQITIETHSVTIIRATGNQFSTYCEHCQTKVVFFTPGQISEILQITLAEVCRRIDTEQFHLTQNGRNTALICGNSLTKINQK